MAVKTALVVEDDKGIQTLLRDVLEQEGFQVMCEKDGEWGLRALQRRLPHVLITDVLLPSLGGFELIEQLRRMPGGDQVPVIAMSGIYRSAKHKKNARERLHVTAYIEKPFELSTIVESLRHALGTDYPNAARADARAMRAAPELHGVEDPLADSETRLEKKEVERAETSFPVARTARGNLKHTRFPEVLSQLYRWRATGALLLRRDETKKIVYLKDGYPSFVKSNVLSECLGRVLVREKMLSEADCEKSLLLMKERQGRQQGTVLIEMGAISPHNLVFGLQLQLEQKLFDIFAWPDGDYQFNPTSEIPSQSVQLDMSLATIVYEGVRRRFTERQLDDLLEPFLDAYVGPHGDPAHRLQDLALEADERRVLALIDGRRTMRELIERAGLGPLHAKQLLYALLATEAAQPLSRASKRKEPLDDVAAVPPPRPSARPPPRKKRGETAPLPSGVVSAEGIPVDELRIRLVERARAMRRQNYFEILGVSRQASLDEMQRAHLALARELHPDKMRGAVPADARALADQLRAQLDSAYETLVDEKRRAAYTRKLEAGQKTAVPDEMNRLLAAEGRFRRGEAALHGGAFAKAAALFREAAELYPEEGEFLVHLAWALFLESPDDRNAQADAVHRLQRGIQLSPRLDKGHLFLGRVLTRVGRVEEAQRAFEQALMCNPDSGEALAELRLAGIPARQRQT